ncbi:hypothetical protein NYE69_12785 [Paenibacillus sp. FSL R5-0527]|uniref:hypothetical protein n=1 Tax=Paenibacillus sp. FSL R5-0527 TaxID=2975321 RepID=UPI00097A9EB3|nr:hypothetical protein BK140_17030 [Paenibacillus macerans]
MVTFNDIIEMHSTIRILEEKQRRLAQLAQEFMSEAESLGGVIATLRSDYDALKKKAKEKSN